MTWEGRAVQKLLPLIKNKAVRVPLAFFAGLPYILFWVLASSHIFHWWDNPAPLAFDRALFEVLLVCSILSALFYGFMSILFWRWYPHNTRDQKLAQSRLLGTYSLLPCIPVVVALWAYESLRGHSATALFYRAVIMGILYCIVTWVLGTLTARRKRKSSPAAPPLALKDL